jgi:hypothetical protein
MFVKSLKVSLLLTFTERKITRSPRSVTNFFLLVSSIILETCNILRWNTSRCWSWQASTCLEKGWRNLATWMCWFEGWPPCSSDVLGRHYLWWSWPPLKPTHSGRQISSAFLQTCTRLSWPTTTCVSSENITRFQYNWTDMASLPLHQFTRFFRFFNDTVKVFRMVTRGAEFGRL